MKKPKGQSAQQLSLWDAPPEQQQEEGFITGPHGEQLPVIIVKSVGGWADGDTSPAALERFALLVLGERRICYSGHCPDPKHQWRYEYGSPVAGLERYYYRIITTAVIDRCVIGALQYESCAMDFGREIDMSPDTGEDL